MGGHGRAGAAAGSGGGQRPRVLSVEPLGEGSYRVLVELSTGERVAMTARVEGDVLVTPFGSFYIPSLRRQTGETGRQRRGGDSRGRGVEWLVEIAGGRVRARLPVRVVEAKRVGDRVVEGETVAVVETMKMLNEIPAPCSGVVVYSAGPGE
jgi:acetyl/propionyl-CoA carboxylase alpha subunit